MVWHRCLKRKQIRLLFVLFIIVFVVGVLLYVPVFEKYVYININKGGYLEKKYFFKINISSAYKKNFKIEKILKEVGLFKEYDDYLFLYGYKSFIFRSTQRLTGPYRFEYFLTKSSIQREDAYDLLKAIQDRNYECYQNTTNCILKNNL